MSRKDYIKMARIFNEFKRRFNTTEDPLFSDLVNEFATMLKFDNNSFDIDRFITACYKGE